MKHLPIVLLVFLAACADAQLTAESGETSLDQPSPAQQGPPPVGSPPVLGEPQHPGPGEDPAPGPDPEDPEPAPPPAAPMVLEITEPARGARLGGRSVHVVGRLTGGAAPELKVAGHLVRPGPEGDFSVEVAVEPGLNVLVTEATDGGRSTDDRRAVMMDADVNPRSPVDDALDVHLGPSGLRAIAALLSDYLNDLDLNALIAGNLPDNVQVESLTYREMRVELIPRDGALEVRLAVHGLQVRLRGTVRFGISVTFSGSASANPAQITARLRMAATPQGGLDIDVVDASVELRNFDYDIRNVPGIVEDWFEGTVRGFAEGLIEDALRDFVVPALFDPASLQREVELLGQTIEIGLRIARVELRATGARLVMKATAAARNVVHAGNAVRAAAGSPRPDTAQDLDLAVAADLASRILHAAWAGGVLDFALDADSDIELPIPLSIALLAPALGEAANGVDRTAPLTVRTRPLLPAVARIEKGARPLVIEAGDLLLDVGTPEGTLVTVAVHLIARATVEIDSLDDITIRPDFEVEVHADVAETPRGPVNERLMQQQVETLAAAIPRLIADQTFTFGADALPVPIPLGATVVEADNAAPYLHLLADIDR